MMRTSRLSFSARITKTGFKAGRGAEPFQHFEQYSGITTWLYMLSNSRFLACPYARAASIS
jgi:hypothetical protein